MKQIFNGIKFFIIIIAALVFCAGIILTILGGYELVSAFFHLQASDEHHVAGLIATGLLKGVDLFLMAIVLFVFSLGILILFHNPETPLPFKLPAWLHIENFMQLKAILWEAILTTLVISDLAILAEKNVYDIEIGVKDLIIPGVILLIAISLFFLKKGEE